MTLTDASLKRGQTVKIIGFKGSGLLQERLHEMGFRQGMMVTLLGRAPFSGPLLIKFNTSFIALRMDEAECAQIEQVPA